MSSVVATIGTSHSAMLAPNPLELWSMRAEHDRTASDLLDTNGDPTTFAALSEAAAARYAHQLDPQTWQEKWNRCQDAIQRLRDDLEALAPDLMLVIGDDQRELFYESLQPALAVFTGAELAMSIGQVPHDLPPDRVAQIRTVLAGLGCDGRRHPGDPAAALHIVRSLVKQGFDVASMAELPAERKFGHAFGWALGPMLAGTRWSELAISTVPVMLNTYYAPNQPTPSRCVDLGLALANAVAGLPGDRRVVVVASGGLSHFVIDEELDRAVLDALQAGDTDALRALPEVRLNSGSSEIRNWLALGGAADGLKWRWSEYVPAYRSQAGTGVGLAFGLWS
jgi:3-O-methylgallate 3,4-dioxygenase